MDNEFCDYDTSLMLKELGFNENCIVLYKPDKSLYKNDISLVGFINSHCHSNRICAPLHQQAEKWLYEAQGIDLSILKGEKYNCIVWKDNVDIIKFTADSPITAKIEGIKTAIQYLKENHEKSAT